MTRAPITFVGDFIEDRLAISQIATPAFQPSNARQLFSVAQATPTSPPEPFAIGPDNTIVRYRVDPTSHSGYSDDAPFGGTGADPSFTTGALFTYYDAGVLNVLAIPSGGAASRWVRNDGTGYATVIPSGPLATALQYLVEKGTCLGVCTDPAGNSYFYASRVDLSPAGLFLGVPNPASGYVELVSVSPMTTDGPDDGYLVVGQVPGGAEPLAVVAYHNAPSPRLLVADLAITPGTGGAGGQATIHVLRSGTPIPLPDGCTIAQLVAAPGGADDVFVLSSDDRLFLVQGFMSFTPGVVELTGLGTGVNTGSGSGSVIGLQVCRDASGLYVVFAIDQATGAALISRQQAPTATQALAFSLFDNLGMTATALAPPPFMAGGIETFFTQTSSQGIGGLSHAYVPDTADGTGAWAIGPMYTAKAATDPLYQKNAFTGYIRTYDPNGNALPNTPVQITVDTAAVIRVDGVAWVLRPGYPAITCTTGCDGSLVAQVTTIDMLAAPELEVTCAGMSAPLTCYFDATVISRLSNSDPLRPMTYTSLSQYGLNTNDDSTELGKLIDTMTQLAKDAEISRDPASASAVGLRGLGARDDQSVIRIQRPRDTRKLAVTYHGSMAEALGSPTAGVFEWAEGVFSDVVAYVSEEVEEFVSLTMQVAGDTVNFVIETVKDLGSRAYKFAVKALADTFRQLVKLAAIMLGGTVLGIVIESAIAVTFFWDDVINTQQVISHMIGTTLQLVPTWTTNVAGPWVGDQIAQLNQYISASLNQLGTVLNKSVDQESTKEGGASVLTTSALATPAGGSNAVQSNWLFDRTVRDTTVSAQLDAQTLASPTSGIATATDYFTLLGNALGVGDSGDGGFAQQVMNVVGAMNLADIATLGSTTVATLLQPLVPLLQSLMSTIGGVATLALDAVASLAQGLYTALTTPITGIPYLSDLFTDVAGGQPLTLLNLIGLVLAIPATGFYVLSQGLIDVPPLFTDAYVTALLASDQILLVQPPSSTGLAAAAPEQYAALGPKQLLTIASAFAFLPLVADPIHDGFYLAGKVPALVSVGSFVALLGASLAAAPWEALVKPVAERTDADNAAIWGFGTCAVQAGVEGFLAFCSLCGIETIEKACPWIKCAAGVLALGGGIYSAIGQFQSKDQPEYSPFSALAAIFAPLPGVAKPLLYVRTLVSALAIAVIDGACNLVTVVMFGAAALTTPKESGEDDGGGDRARALVARPRPSPVFFAFAS